MSLRTVGGLSLVLAGVCAYASVVDRSASWALHVVELDSQLPTPLWGILLGVAVLAFGVGQLRTMATAAAPAPDRAPVVRRRAAPQVAPDRDALVQKIRAVSLPTGARLLLDDPPTIPLHLVVDEAPEKRVRRAVGRLAALLADLPRPPRVRVSMRRCPEPLTPWHHIVSAALAEHLPRSEFKVVPGVDGVDVMFHRPDPSWRRSTP